MRNARVLTLTLIVAALALFGLRILNEPATHTEFASVDGTRDGYSAPTREPVAPGPEVVESRPQSPQKRAPARGEAATADRPAAKTNEGPADGPPLEVPVARAAQIATGRLTRPSNAAPEDVALKFALDRSRLKRTALKVETLGRPVVRLLQLHGGLRVTGAGAAVRVDETSGRVLWARERYVVVPDAFPTSPKVALPAAIELAGKAARLGTGLEASDTELLVYAAADTTPALAWGVAFPYDPRRRAAHEVVVDALTGEVREMGETSM